MAKKCATQIYIFHFKLDLDTFRYIERKQRARLSPNDVRYSIVVKGRLDVDYLHNLFYKITTLLFQKFLQKEKILRLFQEINF